MSNSLVVREMAAAIGAATDAAWDVTRWFPERPRTVIDPSMLPIAIVEWLAVSQTMSGQFSAVGREQSVQQDYQFDVTFVGAFPEDPEAAVAFEKSDRANELIAQVQAGPTFGAFGLLPLVTSIDPGADVADLAEDAYGVRMRFAFSCVADHH